MKFRCVSSHPEDLADGRVVGPGDEVELSEEELKDERNKGLVDRELLLEIKPVDYNTFTAQQLQSLVDSRGTEVEGTGADGNVLKGDLVKALNEDDKKGGGSE